MSQPSLETALTSLSVTSTSDSVTPHPLLVSLSQHSRPALASCPCFFLCPGYISYLDSCCCNLCFFSSPLLPGMQTPYFCFPTFDFVEVCLKSSEQPWLLCKCPRQREL